MPIKKHVCLDGRLIPFSGIGTFLRAIICEFSKNPFFTLSILHHRKDLSFFDDLKGAHLIPIKSPVFSLHEQIELPLKIPSCDLFWSPHFNIPLLSIRAKKRMATIHDTYHLTFFSTLSILQKIYAKCFYNAASFFSDFVTTISEFSKQEILRRCSFKPKNLKVIRLGPKSIYKPLDKNPTLHEKLNLPETYVLAITNFKPHKNFQRILNACQNICPLVVVGEKKEISGALFIGHLQESELAYVYSQATALIFPSLYEGYGLPAIEAMASGSAVIVSKEASLPEVCQEAAEYVNAYDETSIRTGLLHILQDSAYRKSLVAKGLELAKKRTLEDAAKEYIQYVENSLK